MEVDNRVMSARKDLMASYTGLQTMQKAELRVCCGLLSSAEEMGKFLGLILTIFVSGQW